MDAFVPDISVLMPARNAAATLPAAVSSVLSSRGVNFELCVIDHASSDGSTRTLAEYARRDERVRHIQAPGELSLAEVLEYGRTFCRAPFIARMDADDLMHPERLAADRQALEGDAALSAIACRSRLFPKYIGGFGMRAYVAWQNSVLSSQEHQTEIWIEQPCCHPATTFRADVLERVGGYRSGLFPEDYDLFLRIVTQGGQLRKRPLYHHGWRESLRRFTRTDPRASRDAFALTKARYLKKYFALEQRPVLIAGAGKEAGRIARSLLHWGVALHAFYDVNPKRVGRLRHGVPVYADVELRTHFTQLPDAFCIAAVGTSGARGALRTLLEKAGFTEGKNAVVVA